MLIEEVVWVVWQFFGAEGLCYIFNFDGTSYRGIAELKRRYQSSNKFFK
jgi:hypothetical protein